MSNEKLPVPTPVATKKTKKKTVKKNEKKVNVNPKLSREQKAIVKKQLVRKEFAEALEKDFQLLCKKHKVKAVLAFANDKTESLGSIESNGLAHYERVGIVTTTLR